MINFILNLSLKYYKHYLLFFFIFLFSFNLLGEEKNNQKIDIYARGMSNFFMGHHWLNLNKLDLAEKSYRLAYNDFRFIKDTSYIFNSGIKIASILYSNKDYNSALGITDSLGVLVANYRDTKSRLYTTTCCKLSILKFHIYCNKSDLNNAAHELNSILFYAALPEMDEFIQSSYLAKFKFDKLSGNFKQASYSLINLIELSLKSKDYASLSMYFKEMEDLPLEENDTLLSYANKIFNILPKLNRESEAINNNLPDFSPYVSTISENNWMTDLNHTQNETPWVTILIIVISVCMIILFAVRKFLNEYSGKLNKVNKKQILVNKLNNDNPIKANTLTNVHILSNISDTKESSIDNISKEDISKSISNKSLDMILPDDDHISEEYIKKCPLSELESRELFKKIENIMHTQKPFLNPNLKRKLLADLASTNETYIYIAIRNNSKLKTFSDYINWFRVEKACELLVSSKRMNMEEIALESGFTGRTSFYRAFTTLKNQTPNEFRKEKLGE